MRFTALNGDDEEKVAIGLRSRLARAGLTTHSTPDTIGKRGPRTVADESRFDSILRAVGISPATCSVAVVAGSDSEPPNLVLRITFTFDRPRTESIELSVPGFVGGRGAPALTGEADSSAT